MFAIGLASIASSLSSTRMDVTSSIKDNFINTLPKEVLNKMGLETSYYPQFDNPWEFQRSYRRKR